MLLSIVALLFSGVVQAWIAPPASWVWLHAIAWVPAFAVFARVEGRRAFLSGWLVGAAANATIYSWLAGTVTSYGGVPFPAAVAVLGLFALTSGLYAGVFAWGFGRIRRAAGPCWPFAIAVWFCAVEFSSPQIFGYLQGVAWYQHPRIFLVTAFGGVSAMSFLVILVNALALQAIEVSRARTQEGANARRTWRRNLAVGAVLILAALAYSHQRLQHIEHAEQRAPVLRTAVVQPNHTIERRRELALSGLEAFAADLIAQSREAIAAAAPRGGLDVLVWPEGALRADPLDARHRPVRDFARESGVEIWTGANHHGRGADGREVAHNSAFRIDRNGKVDRRYDKNILVPFGEYVPAADWFPLLDAIPTVARFEPGEGTPTYSAGPARFVFLICYEAIRSAYVRDAVRNGANLLVNVTVDAWYGDRGEQSQHLMLAALQSALLGIPMIRSTTTGISAVVDARGVITASAGLFTRETLLAEVRPVKLPGFYARFGDWSAWAAVAVSGMLLLVSRRQRRPRRL